MYNTKFNYQNLVNKNRPLARGLAAWYLCLPRRMGGNTWFDLMGLNHGTLTSMGNVSVTTPDSSGNNNTLTLTNSPTLSTNVPSALGSLSTKSLFCNSVGYGTLSQISLTSDFCISYWINPTSADITGGAFQIGNSSSSTYFIGINTSILIRLRTAVGVTRAFSVPTITAGTWYNITINRVSGVIHVYLNGVESSTGGASDSGTFIISNIGCFNGGSNITNGNIDDVAVFNTALTSTQIANLANGTLDPATLSPVGLWRFESNNGVPTSNGWRATTRPGGYGHVQFDGSAGKINLPSGIGNIGNSSIFSFSFWINWSSVSSVDGLIVGGAISGLYLNSNGTLNWFTGSSNLSTAVLTKNIWYYITLTRTGTGPYTYVYYVNGIISNTFITGQNIGNPFTVFGGAGSEFVNMKFDDFRIYNRKLSTDEVLSVYQDSLTGRYDALNRAA